MNLRRLFPIACCIIALTNSASVKAEPQVYFGNLHSHTKLSDGSGTPAQAYRHAREAAKMDFLAVTEHNHAAAESGAKDRQDGILIANDHSLYNGADAFSLISAAKTYSEPKKFIALYGQEFSSISKGNHVVVLDAPEVIDAENGRFDQLVDWIKRHPDSSGKDCIVQFNHPKLFKKTEIEYGRDDFGDDDDSDAVKERKWIEAMGGVTCLLELLNGPAMTRDGGHRAAEEAEKDYLGYLAQGFRLAPTADQDNHYFTWGTATDARTAVIVDGDLTKESLLAAIRARHVYASEDKNLRIVFTVNGKTCGDVLSAPSPNSALSVSFTVRDDDEPDASYDVIVYRGTVGGSPATPVETFSVTTTTDDDNTPWTIDDIQYTGGVQYFFFKVVQLHEDGQDDRCWTAPVWFQPQGVNDSAPVITATTATPAGVYASKRSNVFHSRANCEFGKAIASENRITGESAREGRRLCRNCTKLEGN